MRRPFVQLAAAFYGLLALAAVGWCWFTDRESVFWIGAPPTLDSVLAWSGVGALFAGVVIIGSDLAAERFPIVRDMGGAFEDVLGDISWPEAFLLGLFSAFGEEMLFRGALLPSFGLIGSTVLFALVHWPMERRLFLWPFFAGAVGLAFGWAFETSGHLAGPIVAHFLVNFVNLGMLKYKDDAQPR